jgi:drug/metabolite transporter (DMT)-like permease
MHLDNHVKFIIGIVFVVIGIVVLLLDRSSRGFGQRRQAGVLFILVGGFLMAVGRGLIHL